MVEISTEKLSKEMHDTLVHRACVMRSGTYLARYLIYRNRSVDAIRLIGRCSVHDISKIQNTEEFMSLASIVDEIDAMHDVEHVLSEKQTKAIKLHWERNSHHPEHYDSSNDMSELDILEMACDCHARSRQYGTDLISYIEKQQEIRFHFDQEHFRKLKAYCVALVELTKSDDYSSVLNTGSIKFDLKDSTMEKLEVFDEDCYSEMIETDRLYLRKEKTADFASVGYSIYQRQTNTEIGYLTLKFNSYIELKIFEGYQGEWYYTEVLSKFIETSTMDEFFITIKKESVVAKDSLERMGFKPMEATENTVTYRFKRPSKKLTKENGAD